MKNKNNKYIGYQTLMKNLKNETHRKKVLLLIALSTATLTLSGCAEKNTKIVNSSIVEEIQESDKTDNNDTTKTNSTTESKTPTESNAPTESNNSTDTEKVDEETDFSKLSKLQFVFSSGAGAWSTMLNINSDGTFQGTYSDSNMGDAEDDYPYGTVYLSEFNGVFSSIEKINDYTDKITIESMNLANQEGTEEIKDGFRYIYSKPYGLSDTKELYVYHKGAPISELPEEFLSWVIFGERGTTLPFVGLYNKETESGFSSYELIDNSIISDEDDLHSRLLVMEESIENLTKRVENDSLTQMEYNQLTKDIYDTLDEQLNYVWGLLKETLDESSMEKLLQEQREWIKYKESEVKKEGEVYEGGSIQAMIEHQKAAELTKIRLYELVELLEKESK